MIQDNVYIKEIRLKTEICKEEGYIKDLPVVNNLDSLALSSNVTFFVGENGSGKSTLLEAIAVNSGFNAEGGTRNFNFSSMETHSDLYKYITVVKSVKRPRDGFFLRAESFYDDNGITKTPYKKTDNYMITRKFLENPEKMMHYLFE